MKVLLVSDTHGQLEIINRLAKENNCEAVIHAGDFGFYDKTSPYRMTEREVKLPVIHSDLPDKEKEAFLKLDLDSQRRYLSEEFPLSDLTKLIEGEMKLEVPVYAVWGNHEDIEVVKKLVSGEISVPNLHLIHETVSYHIDKLHIYGLGGNLLIGKKFFQKPIAGGSGKIWSVIEQYKQLLETVETNRQPDERRLFVSHVSPGKEPFISLMGIHSQTDIILSGHMGPPTAMSWRDFDIRTPEEAEQRLQDWIQKFKDELQKLPEKSWQPFQAFIDQLATLPPHDVNLGRGQRASEWYRNMHNLNLPDAGYGHSILSTDDIRICTMQKTTYRSKL